MFMKKNKLDRRDFLRIGGRVAGAALLAGPVSACARDSGVHVGDRRVPVIDIHAHCGFREVEALIKGTDLEQQVSNNRILTPDRLQVVADRRVDTQVLSINQYWWYAADEGLAAEVVRLHDDLLKAWCDENSGTFVALSSVALQYPELAADQLEYAVNELGFPGASVGGHVNGMVPSGPEYDAFWAKAEELDVPVFVHPGGATNIVQHGSLDGRGDLENIVGNPLETTVFLTKMIFDGTLDRFPNLKIVGAHAGGYLPSYLGRTEVACEFRRNADCANTRKPSEYLRDQILVDSMIFSDEGLRHLYKEMGASQIVYGTDIPFNWPDTLQLILDANYLTDDEKIAMLGGNLKRLLKLP